jgi:hypothetical protein
MLSALLISIIILKIGIKDILNEISRIDVFFIILIFAMFLLLIFVEAFTIKILSDKIRFIPLKKMFVYYLLSWSFAVFFLGRIGEFSLVYFLGKEKINVGRAAAITIINKTITLVSLAFVSMIGVVYFFGIIESIKLLSLFALILASFFVILLNHKVRFLVRKYILRKYETKFEGFSKTFFYFIRSKKKAILANFLMTFVKWSLNALMYSLLFFSMGENVSLLFIIIIESISSIVSLLPISIGGLGVRESIGIYLFTRVGINPETSAAVYFVFLAMTYLISLVSVFFMNTIYKEPRKLI